MSNRFTIAIPADELDLGLCLSSGQVFRWAVDAAGVWTGVDGDSWYRASAPDVALPDVQVLTHATGLNRDPGRNALAYVAETRSSYASGMVVWDVESNGNEDDFRRLFRLDWDAKAVRAEILRRGPELEPYLEVMTGLRLLRPSSPTEAFFSFLCTPNNNIPRIVTMVRHLASYGPLIGDSGYHRFPNVETIADTPESDLRARGFGYRAATIPSIAKDVVSRGGSDYIESLKSVPFEEAHRELLTFKGIGPKLADCIALFALHHTDSVPIDTHLMQAATRLYFPQWQGTNLTDKKYDAMSAYIRNRFGELTGWAHQCMFYDNVLNWRSRKPAQELGSAK